MAVSDNRLGFEHAGRKHRTKPAQKATKKVVLEFPKPKYHWLNAPLLDLYDLYFSAPALRYSEHTLLRAKRPEGMWIQHVCRGDLPKQNTDRSMIQVFWSTFTNLAITVANAGGSDSTGTGRG